MLGNRINFTKYVKISLYRCFFLAYYGRDYIPKIHKLVNVSCIFVPYYDY